MITATQTRFKKHRYNSWDDLFNSNLEDPLTAKEWARILFEDRKEIDVSAQQLIDSDYILSINIEQAIGRATRIPVTRVQNTEVVDYLEVYGADRRNVD